MITESTETYVAFTIQSDSINKDDRRAIESVHIKPVEFRENVRAFFSVGRKQTVHNNEMSILLCF